MKALFDFGRAPVRRVKTITVLLAALAVVASGCSKANTSAPAVTPSQRPAAVTPSAPAPDAQATPAAPSQPMATNSTNGLTTLQLLNRALIHWMIKNRRHPQTFEDFASSANIQIPDPPVGKKYSLDGRGFIVLVDNQ